MGPIGINYNLLCDPPGPLGLVHSLEWRQGDGTFISGVYSDSFFGEYLAATLNFGQLNDSVHRGIYICTGVNDLVGVTVHEESNTILVNGEKLNVYTKYYLIVTILYIYVYCTKCGKLHMHRS